MRLCRAIFLAGLVLVVEFLLPVQAHVMSIIPFSEMFEKADLVVIARPLTKTTDTAEQAKFDDLVEVDGSGKQSAVMAIGVETTFHVLEVVKGPKSLTRFVLHHYREAPHSGDAFDGPDTVVFDPANPRRRDILLFLVKEKDGRYGPYGGQTDPSDRSIFALDDPQ